MSQFRNHILLILDTVLFQAVLTVTYFKVSFQPLSINIKW